MATFPGVSIQMRNSVIYLRTNKRIGFDVIIKAITLPALYTSGSLLSVKLHLPLTACKSKAKCLTNFFNFPSINIRRTYLIQFRPIFHFWENPFIKLTTFKYKVMASTYLRHKPGFRDSFWCITFCSKTLLIRTTYVNWRRNFGKFPGAYVSMCALYLLLKISNLWFIGVYLFFLNQVPT